MLLCTSKLIERSINQIAKKRQSLSLVQASHNFPVKKAASLIQRDA